MEKLKKNLDESIYSRLKNVAKQRKRPVQEILKYYAIERFLFRLSASSHQIFFYLKGGLMLMVWNPMNHRPTVDIDLLAKTSNTVSHLQKIIHEICSTEVIPDGLLFDVESLRLSEAQLEAEYHGISASFSAKLFTAKLPMRIDFGFSDTILPQPAIVKYPTLLDLPAPTLEGYTPQTSIVEKFESIIRLGFANTRMKDFYDIWLLIQQFDFDRDELQAIIQQIIKNRGTIVKSSPIAFEETCYNHPLKQDQWKAFLKDISHEVIPLKQVMLDLRNFFSKLIF
ncbi:nucleotidyl transferase AbiEii/AbiGii toxin family protein [Neochlamydia sp. EPS4]|uniref:nucleotidyl transferase AbiEii/AbiGii toxin family protein n=1 Tax=Neochlamydia sp. EPS4 TaxID=1478175 RepID=UPI0005D10298|nr:nucleotidyl transferase AbiEii/AbiGii toxin family protein [Neochlamydia sp. EPS4]